MKKLNVAILGQGRSGWKIHGKALLDAPDKFDVVAVVDPVADRREKAAARYGKDLLAYLDLEGQPV